MDTYNDGLEAAAKYHDEQSVLFKKRAIDSLLEPCPLPDVSDAQDQMSDFHKQSAMTIRMMKR